MQTAPESTQIHCTYNSWHEGNTYQAKPEYPMLQLTCSTYPWTERKNISKDDRSKHII